MQIKDTFARLDDTKRQQMGEVLRFVIVGIIATLLQYGIYSALILFIPNKASAAQIQLYSTVAMSIGYAISFVFNFLASTHYTFKVKANARRGAGFVLSHVINYLLQIGTLNLFLWLGISRQWAPVPMFCICVPVNFILVRFFLKH